MNWTEKLRKLHDARERANNYKETVVHAEEQHRKQFEELYAGRDDAICRVMELEDELRTAAVEQYNTNPTTKEICPGMNIRVTTSYEYDAARAKDWAIDHGLCLTLDAKAFKDICKAESTRPSFVEVVSMPSATIATDLSKVLE